MTAADLIARLSDDPGRDMDAHLLCLYSIARFLPAQKAVEIGTDDGSSTLPLLLGVGENGGHLWSVDPAPCEGAKRVAAASGYQSCWTFLRHVSANAAEVIPDGLDLVLIDGDHTEQGVATDWRLYEPKVRPGGMLLFHDYCNRVDFPGISKLIDEEIRPQWEKYEVLTMRWGWGLTLVTKL